MKKSKFSEHQIVNILKEYESGKATKDICREHGISAPKKAKSSRLKSATKAKYLFYIG